MARRSGSASGGSAPEAPAHPRRPFRVLVVDREPAIHLLIQKCLDASDAVLTQVHSLEEARGELEKSPADLVLIEPQLPDGSGMELAQDLRRQRPSTHTIVITGQPNLECAIEAIRVGAADYMVKPLNMTALNLRVREVMTRQRADRGTRQRLRRLQRLCLKLNRARQEVTEQVDILCNDLVVAYQELATQMNQVMQAGELNAVVGQELDLEQLLRKVLEYLLDKAGPTNAAIFLPTGTQDFTLGGYINFDCSAGTTDLVLQHLADTLAPRIAQNPALVQLTENQALRDLIGDDWAYLADAHVLGIACRNKGEPLAVLVLFRDASQPFAPTVAEVLRQAAPVLGERLAKLIRIHHRHLPGLDELPPAA